MKKAAILLVAGVAAGASAPASADIMTFNGVEGDGQNTLRAPGFVFIEGDWQYEVITASVFTLDNDHSGFGAADDDVVFFQNGANAPSITFTNIFGSSFDALNVDTIGGFSEGNGTLLFTGHFTAGGSISQAVPVSHGVITNTDLPGFVGLSSLDVDQNNGTGNFLALDNITLIPGPAALAMFGIAGLAVGSRRRR